MPNSSRKTATTKNAVRHPSGKSERKAAPPRKETTKAETSNETSISGETPDLPQPVVPR